MTHTRNRIWITALTLVATMLPAAVAAEPKITNAPKAQKTNLQVDRVARGLEHPWGLQFLPDGRFLVTERPGRLRIVSKDGKISPPVKGVPKVHARGQGGLLDVRLARDFDTSNTIFLSYAEPKGNGQSATAVARAQLLLDDQGGGELNDVQVIFRQKPSVSSGYHFGSRIVLADDDSLFITTGDRGSRRDAAQDPAIPIGAVIRINPDGTPHKDNPKIDGWAPEIWSIGHRNIQGAVMAPDTQQLWTVEHGARGGDELNHPQKGKNYGWPVITYGRDYSGAKIGIGTKKNGLEQPVYYWDPSIAVSGLELYQGKLFPQWKGNLLVGGLSGTRLERLVLDDDKVIEREILLKKRGERVRDVRQGPDGAIYVLTDSARGSLLKLTPKT